MATMETIMVMMEKKKKSYNDGHKFDDRDGKKMVRIMKMKRMTMTERKSVQKSMMIPMIIVSGRCLKTQMPQ